ncbi:hypothetical protein HN873_048740 [Arachis hypogaea]
MDFDPDEEIIAQVDKDLMNNVPEDRASRENITRGEDGRRGEILRDTIAAEMWNDYIRGDMDSEKVSDVEGKNECDTYFKWTMEMNGLMLEVLKEQKNKGQKEDRAFSAESYRKVVEEINEKFSVSINKSKVLNRLKTLKKQMVLAKEINQQSGANPKFKAIRGKHLYHLKILKEIYNKDIANGMRVETVWKTSDMREALTKLGLQDCSFCEALEWLVTHPTLLGVFFGLPEELRLEWLREKMDFEF